MSRPKKNARPEPINISGANARVLRGPRDGCWYWNVRYSLEGKRESLSLGWLSRPDAERAVAELVANGLPTAPPGSTAPEVRTFRELARLWGREQDERVDSGVIRERTGLAIRGAVKRLTGKTAKTKTCHFADVTLDRLAITDLARYQHLSGYASGTVCFDLTVAASIWNWGRKLGYGPGRDLPKWRVDVRPARNRRTPSAGEVTATVRWLEVHAPAWVVLGVRLLACGLRVGEVATLTWEMVDFQEVVIWPAEKTRPRAVPLGDPATVVALQRAWLAAGRPAEGLVLGVDPVTARAGSAGLRVWVAKSCKALCIKVWTPHGARRLAVDTLARSGVDIATAADLLGHSPTVMLRSYRQVSDADRRSAVKKAGLGVLVDGEEDSRRSGRGA